MPNSKPKAMKRGLFAALCIASLVLGTVNPAAAAVVAGAGAGTGGDYPDGLTFDECDPEAENPMSAEVTDYRLLINHTGTYTGTQVGSGGPVVYAGDTLVTVTADLHHISPIGTHNDPCVNEVAPIGVTVDVYGDDGNGEVDCPGGLGFMTRVQSAVVVTFSGECSLKGNVPLASGNAGSSDMDHTLEGVLTPCIEVDTPPQEDPDLPGDNVNPCDGVPVPESDPGSIYAGTYEAVPTQ